MDLFENVPVVVQGSVAEDGLEFIAIDETLYDTRIAIKNSDVGQRSGYLEMSLKLE